jgi:CspA family cold shock protein
MRPWICLRPLPELVPCIALARCTIDPVSRLLARFCAAPACAAHQPTKEIDMTTQTGIVKWFDEGKGYGFITPDDGGKDLFAHFREIKGDAGFKTLVERQHVQFEVTQGQKGPQASNIRLTSV